MVGTNGALALWGILPVSADASASTGVKEAQVAKEDSNGQAKRELIKNGEPCKGRREL